MSDQAGNKNFDIKTISDFSGYISSIDKTKVSSNVVVKGSLNMYKKDSGTWATREGQKRLGAIDTTLSPISSAYVWNTSWGATLPLVVSNSNLYVVYGASSTWYSLASGLTKTRYVFDKWYDDSQKKDRLLFVNGTSSLGNWSGGISTIASGNFSTGQVALIAPTPTAAGSNYTVGDILTISTGGTLATVSVDSVGTGTILTVAVANGGYNYKVGDVLTLIGGDRATGGTVTVSTIGGSGEITAVTLTTPGIGFLGGFGYQVSGGVGRGAIITASTVSTAGSVTSLSLVSPGTTYTTGAGKATTGGTGTGCTVNIITIATGRITKLDTATTFKRDGFADSGGIKIGASTFVYSYVVGNFLVGIDIDPSSIVSGTVGLQTVTTYTNFLPQNALSDFIKVINNRVYSGSYNSRLINISSSADFTNFTVPSSTVPGSANLLILDSNAVGIGVRQGNPHIGFGNSSWMVVTYPTYTNSAGVLLEKITPDVKPVANLAAPFAHEFIDTVGDTLVYLAQDQQVRTFGDFANLFTPKYPSLSQHIKTELEEEVFTGGALRCIGDMTYLIAPNSGKVYIYKVRESPDQAGNVVAERLWFAPFVWSVTRVDVIRGVIYGFSSQNPQIYQLWDTNQWYDDCPADEQLPYSCVLAFAYRTTVQRSPLQSFDKIYTEGYLAPGAVLTLLVNYEYGGAKSQTQVPINSVALPAYTLTPSVLSLGDESLGEASLGDDLLDDGMSIPKFKVINSLSDPNCFEWQPVYFSDLANSRWEILATGSNATISKEDPVYIINKRRT